MQTYLYLSLPASLLMREGFTLFPSKTFILGLLSYFLQLHINLFSSRSVTFQPAFPLLPAGFLLAFTSPQYFLQPKTKYILPISLLLSWSKPFKDFFLHAVIVIPHCSWFPHSASPSRFLRDIKKQAGIHSREPTTCTFPQLHKDVTLVALK